MNELTELPRTQQATQSANSREWLLKQTEALRTLTSASDVLKQFARLASNYGDSRISTTEQRTLLLREWLEAFGNHSPTHLHEAVSAAMKACKFWPTIAEVSIEISAIRREAVSVIGITTGTGRWKADNAPFARDGRTEAEEIAHRAAVALKWKQDYGFGQSEPDPLDVKAKPKGASQDTGVSHWLTNSCAARRATKRATCTDTCGYRTCNLREKEDCND